jgi:LPS sulfotransferase NodH
VRGPDFVILCMGRTGSSHLRSLLDSHPQIACLGEVLDPRGFGYDRARGPREYVSTFFKGLDARVRGFKLPLDSIIQVPESLDLVDDPSMRIVRLKRPNYLAHFVSNEMARASGVWHSHDGPAPNLRLQIPVERCLAWFRDCAYNDRMLDSVAGSSRTFQITYDELRDGDKLAGLQQFLGVDPQLLSSRFAKLTERPLEDILINWDDIATALAGTRWEWFLARERVGIT